LEYFYVLTEFILPGILDIFTPTGTMLFYNKTLWFVPQSFIKNMNSKIIAIELNKSIKFLSIL